MTIDDLPHLDGRTVLVTGANSGIGLETAVACARLGARIAITTRDAVKGAIAVSEIEQRAGRAADLFHVDLADLVSVRRCADEVLERLPELHVLVCNAGLTLSKRTETAQGLEYLFGVNHLGHFLLVDLLRQRLIESAPARVVVVSSEMHRVAYRGLAFDDLQSTRRYVSYDVYGKTKLANILFTRELSRRLDGTGVTANAVHPGLVQTNFGGEGDTRITQQVVRRLPRQLARNAEDGADTVVYLVASDDVADATGGYYSNRRLTEPSSQARDDEAAARLWQVSEELIASLDTAPAPFSAEGPVHTVVVPADFDGLVGFYRDTLGFERALETSESVQLRLAPGSILELVRDRDPSPQGMALTVVVESLATAEREVRRRQVAPGATTVEPDGAQWFEITDPEGNALRFLQPATSS